MPLCTFFVSRAGALGTRVSMNSIHMKILRLQKVNSKPCALLLKYVRGNIVRFCEKTCNCSLENVGGRNNCLTEGSFVTATLISSLNAVA